MIGEIYIRRTFSVKCSTFQNNCWYKLSSFVTKTCHFSGRFKNLVHWKFPVLWLCRDGIANINLLKIHFAGPKKISILLYIPQNIFLVIKTFGLNWTIDQLRLVKEVGDSMWRHFFKKILQKIVKSHRITRFFSSFWLATTIWQVFF